MTLQIFVTMIFFIVVIVCFIWTILSTGKAINNLEEDDDGFYDKRTRK